MGKSKDGKDVYLKDIWPTNKEIEDTLLISLNADMFKSRYDNVAQGPKEWQDINIEPGSIYEWDDGSSYVKRPPFFDNMTEDPEGFKEIKDARPLVILGDSVTTDHISPAGSIPKDSPTGDYFMKYQIQPKDFNSYGARRGNHEVMMRGTFGNIRVKNEMAPGNRRRDLQKSIQKEKRQQSLMLSLEYKKRGTPLVVFGGKLIWDRIIKRLGSKRFSVTWN